MVYKPKGYLASCGRFDFYKEGTEIRATNVIGGTNPITGYPTPANSHLVGRAQDWEKRLQEGIEKFYHGKIFKKR